MHDIFADWTCVDGVILHNKTQRTAFSAALVNVNINQWVKLTVCKQSKMTRNFIRSVIHACEIFAFALPRRPHMAGSIKPSLRPWLGGLSTWAVYAACPAWKRREKRAEKECLETVAGERTQCSKQDCLFEHWFASNRFCMSDGDKIIYNKCETVWDIHFFYEHVGH